MLTSGLPGATILAVFSSSLPETFVLPRTVPATAILFKEADARPISRKTSFFKQRQKACSRAVLPLGNVKKKLSPITKKISKITQPFTSLKSKIYNKLGLSCLVPKLLRPFHPFIEKVSCKFGLNTEDEYVEGKFCSRNNCNEPSLENKVVTNDLGLPNLDYLIEGQVSTMSDCFKDMPKVTYGSRVLAKIVDDQPCEDIRYQGICQELMIQNRVLFEENCRSPG